ncbi:MAG: FAD-binding protein [Deltaproteobacteria bacterium]|uniref:FAD-binding protein n=1 Tax=Candidatus Zymogenus saltonus TaxID=2844893 RepID=A0A9D8PNC7_9DELT|nr:FAD-binding protein [Candidatus Zymogenus saltonus]
MEISIDIGGVSVPVIDVTAAVVGSGAAALNGAVHLKRLGVDDVVIVTERLGAGTSANAGSDKQTYYRLNPEGGQGDDAASMAKDLFNGMGMHGDIALVEAALSSREFYHLVELGVPFPHDRFGRYVGYKTDHDQRSRGTSAGPNTSILMYGRLLDEVRRLEVPILDNLEVVDLVTVRDGGKKRICGLIAVDRTRLTERGFGLVLIEAGYVIYGIGGPAALYRESVYPKSQVGSTGIALKAGAAAQNLAESQFGIASTPFRWNLSGSYQQVIPRYFSVEGDGGDEREFLNDYFPTPGQLFEAQFLKGYQWPFDVRRIDNFGSSNIDLAVYIEREARGRRVFLDYTKNPAHGDVEFSVDTTPEVVREYLEKSNALGKTPVERLKAMNPPALELFKENGIDLEREPVETAVCHQHVNGGLACSVWWESNIENLFSVGECCGTHGVYRPGGSALNSGQVGSLRAAQMIAKRSSAEDLRGERGLMEERLAGKLECLKRLLASDRKIDPAAERGVIQERMSAVMGIVRNRAEIKSALEENKKMFERHKSAGVEDRGDIPAFLKNEDLLLTERGFLESALELLKGLKGSRGSFLVGRLDELVDLYIESAGRGIEIDIDESNGDTVVEFAYDENLNGRTRLVKARKIPSQEGWFEEDWREFREGKIYQ